MSMNIGQWYSSPPPLGSPSFPGPAFPEAGPVPSIISPDTQGPDQGADLTEPASIITEAQGVETEHPESDLALGSIISLADIRAALATDRSGAPDADTVSGRYIPPLDLSVPLEDPDTENYRLRLLREADGNESLWASTLETFGQGRDVLRSPETGVEIEPRDVVAGAVRGLLDRQKEHEAYLGTERAIRERNKARMSTTPGEPVITEADTAHELLMEEMTAKLAKAWENSAPDIPTGEYEELLKDLPEHVRNQLLGINAGQQG